MWFKANNPEIPFSFFYDILSITISIYLSVNSLDLTNMLTIGDAFFLFKNILFIILYSTDQWLSHNRQNHWLVAQWTDQRLLHARQINNWLHTK